MLRIQTTPSGDLDANRGEQTHELAGSHFVRLGLHSTSFVPGHFVTISRAACSRSHPHPHHDERRCRCGGGGETAIDQAC